MINKFFKLLVEKIPENNRHERIWKLAQVDFKKRYYNDKLGIFWAFLNPVLRVTIYYFVFTYLLSRARIGVDNFALFIFSALIFWTAFTEMMRKGLKIFKEKGYLIKNIRINKIDLFISSGLAIIFGFMFNLVAYLIIAIAFFEVTISWSILLLPILIVNLYLLGIGIGMILSVLHIFYKDVHHILDYIVLFGFWTSGVFFPAERIIEFWKPLYYLNPLTGILKNVRALIVYNGNLDIEILFINMTFGVIVYLIGVFCVKRYSTKVFENI